MLKLLRIARKAIHTTAGLSILMSTSASAEGRTKEPTSIKSNSPGEAERSVERVTMQIERVSDEISSLVQKIRSETSDPSEISRLRELNSEYERLSFELEKILSSQHWESLSQEDESELNLEPGPVISEAELRELTLGH